MEVIRETIDLRDLPDAKHLREAPSEPRWFNAAVERDRRRGRLEGRLLIVFDMAAIGLATVMFGLWSRTAVVLIVAMFIVLVTSGDYRRPRVTLSVTADLPRLLSRCSVPLLLIAVDAAWQPVQQWVFRFMVAMTAAVAGMRFLSFGLIRTLRIRGLTRQRAVIVGAGVVGAQLEAFLREHPVLGVEPVGIVDDTGSEHIDNLLGTVQDLPMILQTTGARFVILAFGSASDIATVDLLRSLPAGRVEIFVVPRFFEVGGAAGDPLADDIWGLPLVWLRRRSSRGTMLLAKRLFDISMSLLLLLLTAPLLAFGALAVATTSRGPIFFRQVRTGRNGERFDLLKLRSMHFNTDSDTQWTVTHDVRVTPVGRFLRRTSLDELPQLINVLRGDMSLVGPRPERPFYVEQFGRTVPHYDARHRAPVGLTGWAQIHGLRGNSSIDDRVRFDNAYIDNWSIWRDLTILARTVSAMWRGE